MNLVEALQRANNIVSIQEIVEDFNKNEFDYTGLSDLEMYIEYFRQYPELAGEA